VGITAEILSRGLSAVVAAHGQALDWPPSMTRYVRLVLIARGGAKALAMASTLKGMDDSKVEVDDEQSPPTIAAGSPEEAALVSKLNEALMESGVMTRWEAFKAVSRFKDLPTMCLRGRKYDVSRAAELLPRLMGMIEEMKLETEPGRLHEDLATRKILAISTEDKSGRTIIWVRFRFHDPKVSPAKDVARTVESAPLGSCSIRPAEGGAYPSASLPAGAKSQG
jgi:hypothetical protein